MTSACLSAAVVMGVLCLACSVSRSRHLRTRLSVAAVLILATAVPMQLFLHFGPADWHFDEFDNAIFLSAGWAPLFVCASALLAYVAYTLILKPAPVSRLLWVGGLVLCAISAYFALQGRVDHPVASGFSVSVIAWLVALYAAGTGVTADLVRCCDDAAAECSSPRALVFRKAVYGDSLWLSSFAALLALVGQHVASGSFALSSPVFMFPAGMAAIALAGYLRTEKDAPPYSMVYTILWSIAYGLWLEFA